MKNSDEYIKQRKEMVREQIKARGIKSPLVLDALFKVKRHLFVPLKLKDIAYYDGPLPIGKEQTISQPYIVALMTELLDLKKSDRVLEVGTGSGYQAAVLAEIIDEVYSIEIIEDLYVETKEKLNNLGYDNIYLKLGDGSKGWKEKAPFDKIIVTAAALSRIPQSLSDQLKEGGIIVIPVGEWQQELILGTKIDGEIKVENIIPVRFVPLVENDSNNISEIK